MVTGEGAAPTVVAEWSGWGWCRRCAWLARLSEGDPARCEFCGGSEFARLGEEIPAHRAAAAAPPPPKVAPTGHPAFQAERRA